MNKVEVVESAGKRMLKASGLLFGGYDPKRPAVPLLPVSHAMAASLMIAVGTPSTLPALHLGLGGGELARFSSLALRLPTTAVDNSPDVIRMARAHMGVEDARVNVVDADAMEYLTCVAQYSLSWITVDVYELDGKRPDYKRQTFYWTCRSKLEQYGVMAINFFGDADLRKHIKWLEQLFGGLNVYAATFARPGNTVIWVTRTQRPVHPSLATLQENAAKLTRLGINVEGWHEKIVPLDRFAVLSGWERKVQVQAYTTRRQMMVGLTKPRASIEHHHKAAAANAARGLPTKPYDAGPRGGSRPAPTVSYKRPFRRI
jgi:spermidine synthase